MKRAVVTTAGRLDATVRAVFGLSNKAAKAAVRSGKIFVDDQRQLDGAFVVAPGAAVVLDEAAPRPSRTEPYGVRLLFRDVNLLVIDKPAGLVSSPAPSVTGPTALDAALSLCRGHRGAKVVHRLDKDTSGLMMFARSVRAARELRSAMEAGEIQRTYHAVVDGVPRPPEGVIVSMMLGDRGDGYKGSAQGTRQILPLGSTAPEPDERGRQAITRYRTVESVDGRSAITVRLGTGRTHQIRIHFAEMGCPVVGERIYARRSVGGPRQALHAAHLTLAHPISGQELRFFSPWPDDLADISPIGPDWSA